MASPVAFNLGRENCSGAGGASLPQAGREPPAEFCVQTDAECSHGAVTCYVLTHPLDPRPVTSTSELMG